jgi:hypothetical protein
MQTVNMETNTNEEQKQDLTWLENLQKHSWEPEVIISGIILAFIFAFPAKVNDFAIRIIQDFGLNYLGAQLVLIYISLVINIFKIFFILHLCLRFAWAGLLGLSYAFPQGVIKEQLFKYARHYNYAQPADMVLHMERICSMTFAFPLMLGIIFIVIACYLSILLFVYKVFNLAFAVIYLFFLISIILFSLLNLINRKSVFKARISRTIFSSVQATYQSNLGKWSISGYIFFILVLTVPLVKIDIADFSLYFQASNLNDEQAEWPNKSWYFDNHKEAGKRFPRILLPSEEISVNLSTINLAYFDEDREHIAIIHAQYKHSLDTLQWQQVRTATDLYRFYMNDSLIHLSGWKKVRLAGSGQRAYQSVLNVAALPPGNHDVRVEKLLVIENPFSGKRDIRLRKNWAKFSFIKTY